MNRLGQAGVVAVASIAGVAAAMGAAAGNDDITGCVNTAAGTLREQGEIGHCVRGEVPVAIKAAKNKTLTINGVAFKQGRGKTLTINGVAFKKGSGKTLTINGVAFKGSGKTLTINGVAFKKSRGGTLTINGVAFKKGSGNTLTINGTAFGPGAAGKQGAQGPQGPPGVVAPGPAPSVVAGPVPVSSAAGAVGLTSAAFRNSDGKPHRLLVAGGFDVACSPAAGACTAETKPTWSLANGAAKLIERGLALVPENGDSSAAINEIVVAPSVCNPCTLTLKLTATSGGGGGAQTLDATDIRLGIVDLGPVG